MRLLSLLLALQAPAQPARAATPDTAHIVIVATTDIHGRVLGWDYVRDAATPGGLSRAATALETLRARYPSNLILVDAGDLLQGNPFATFFGRYGARPPGRRGRRPEDRPAPQRLRRIELRHDGGGTGKRCRGARDRQSET